MSPGWETAWEGKEVSPVEGGLSETRRELSEEIQRLSALAQRPLPSQPDNDLGKLFAVLAVLLLSCLLFGGMSAVLLQEQDQLERQQRRLEVEIARTKDCRHGH